MNRLLSFFFVILAFYSTAQFKKEKFKLDLELSEISGLEVYNDSTLIAVNDGGNSSTIFFLDLKGSIIKRTVVANARNHDWEDLTVDDSGHLYVADIGNNLQNRKDLAVLKIDLRTAYVLDTVHAEAINVSYSNQIKFETSDVSCYDAEAIYWHNDSLHVLTKIRTRPVNNEQTHGTYEYSFPDLSGDYTLIPNQHYFTGGKNRLKFQVTAADRHGEKLMILTYGRIFVYNVGPVPNLERTLKLNRYSQYESIVFLDERTIFIASEKHPLSKAPHLLKLTLK
jgi:hypothetical protein